MLCTGDLLAVLILVSPSGLMFDKLRTALRVPTFTQMGKVIGPNGPDKIPLLCKFALPLAVRSLVTAPVVLFLGREFTGVVCLGLSGGQRFGDGQHALRLYNARGSISLLPL
jgi:hypothetical protein